MLVGAISSLREFDTLDALLEAIEKLDITEAARLIGVLPVIELSKAPKNASDNDTVLSCLIENLEKALFHALSDSSSIVSFIKTILTKAPIVLELKNKEAQMPLYQLIQKLGQFERNDALFNLTLTIAEIFISRMSVRALMETYKSGTALCHMMNCQREGCNVLPLVKAFVAKMPKALVYEETPLKRLCSLPFDPKAHPPLIEYLIAMTSKQELLVNNGGSNITFIECVVKNCFFVPDDLRLGSSDVSHKLKQMLIKIASLESSTVNQKVLNDCSRLFGETFSRQMADIIRLKQSLLTLVTIHRRLRRKFLPSSVPPVEVLERLVFPMAQALLKP